VRGWIRISSAYHGHRKVGEVITHSCDGRVLIQRMKMWQDFNKIKSTEQRSKRKINRNFILWQKHLAS
jgi:hypothetical protein